METNQEKDERASGFSISEKNGDLFAAPVTSSLAHCISRDCKLGAGIALVFREKFGRVDEIEAAGADVGDVAVLKDGERFIYNLVTKERYFHKPTYDTLETSLKRMKEHAVSNKVEHICMPLIGCGLDLLEWSEVKPLIKDVFKDTEIQIVIYLGPDKKKAPYGRSTRGSSRQANNNREKSQTDSRRRSGPGNWNSRPRGYQGSGPLPGNFYKQRVQQGGGSGSGNWERNQRGGGSGSGNWERNQRGGGSGSGNWDRNHRGGGTGSGNWDRNHRSGGSGSGSKHQGKDSRPEKDQFQQGRTSENSERNQQGGASGSGNLNNRDRNHQGSSGSENSHKEKSYNNRSWEQISTPRNVAKSEYAKGNRQLHSPTYKETDESYSTEKHELETSSDISSLLENEDKDKIDHEKVLEKSATTSHRGKKKNKRRKANKEDTANGSIEKQKHETAPNVSLTPQDKDKTEHGKALEKISALENIDKEAILQDGLSPSKETQLAENNDRENIQQACGGNGANYQISNGKASQKTSVPENIEEKEMKQGSALEQNSVANENEKSQHGVTSNLTPKNSKLNRTGPDKVPKKSRNLPQIFEGMKINIDKDCDNVEILKKKVKALGGEVVDHIQDATHHVHVKGKRSDSDSTRSCVQVELQWLEDSIRNKQIANAKYYSSADWE